MKLKLKEKVEGEIITLDDAKSYIRVNGNFDDNLIQILIKSGREIIEKVLHQPILRETWGCKYCRTEFLSRESRIYPNIYRSTVTIPFPKKPVLEVRSVFADDCEINPKNYCVEKLGPSYYLVIRNVRHLNNVNSFSFEFDTGIAKDVRSVPSIFRIANLMIVAQHYENRNSNENFVPASAQTLLTNYMQFGGF